MHKIRTSIAVKQTVVSFVVSVVLLRQAYASFHEIPDEFQSYPFMNYPMYAATAHEGSEADLCDYYVTHSDRTVHHLAPEDFGQDLWTFDFGDTGIGSAMSVHDSARLRTLARLYKRLSHHEPVEFRMVVRTQRFTAQGIVQSSVREVREPLDIRE